MANEHELTDTKKLLAHAVRLLRLHVSDGAPFDPRCAWNNGEPCYTCRTRAFLADNFPQPLCKVCGRKSQTLSHCNETGEQEPCSVCGRPTACVAAIRDKTAYGCRVTAEHKPPVMSPPCQDCGGSSGADASACPLCGKVVCQLCAERDGSSCCDEPRERAEGMKGGV